ncbi:MAG: response regulator [Deltaproteobacteria bacterium]|nr:response regulator [Deltaproteobacteria bacterium]MBW2072078.1 response regulator [Deltaproteobacteria bacterium]
MAATVKRALVVASDVYHGIEVSSALERLGCAVDVASSGVEALRLIARGTVYQLIVTELVLNGISGLALAIAARQKEPAVRIIGVNNGKKALLLVAREFGIDDVLELPLDGETVFCLVSEIIKG